EVHWLLSYRRTRDRLLHQTLDEELQMAARIGRKRPSVDFLGNRLERQCAFRAREGFIHRALLLHGLANGLVVGNGAYVLQSHIEETVSHLGQLSKEIAPLLGTVSH